MPILPSYLMELEEREQGTATAGTNDTSGLDNMTSVLSSVKTALTRLHHGKGIIVENKAIGWLFSSKAVVQFLWNPISSRISNRFGNLLLIFLGVLFMLLTCTFYAFGESYAVLFVGRAVHGAGASAVGVGGMALLAHSYPEDKERSQNMAFALGGQALGVLIGYPLGGTLFYFYGKAAPFLVVQFMLVAVLLMCLVAADRQRNGTKEVPAHGSSSMFRLFQDPYILIAAGCLAFPEMAMASLEPILPIWLKNSMHLEQWQIGLVFVPDSVGFLLGTNVFIAVGDRMERWVCLLFCLLVVGFCLFVIPFAHNIWHLVLPHFGLGLGLGMSDACVFPLLSFLMDRRHGNAYGTVYGLGQTAISFAFSAGPTMGGMMFNTMGFSWAVRLMALCNLLFAPMAIHLRNPPAAPDGMALLRPANGRIQSHHEMHGGDSE